LGTTPSLVAFTARWHAASTGRLDLLAAWTEGIDRGPGTAPPREEAVEVVVGDLQSKALENGDAVVVAPMRARHEHGDTKHRRIGYRLEATGAFLDDFVETRRFSFPLGANSVDLDGIDPEGIAPSTVRLSGPRSIVVDAPIVTFRREGDLSLGDGSADYRITSTPGSTVATVTRIGSAIPRGPELTLRFVTNPISHRSPVVVRNVFASARPAAPDVHSVVPTFDWDRTSSNGTITSTRGLAGVRIWLKRPWWSSGLGEALAVLYRTGTGQPSESAARFVSVWGRDPLHAATNVRGSMADTAFPLRSGPSLGLRPPGGPIVRAVPHPVFFDDDRDMWYCDVDLNLGSYWPFVRLAVARFQPNAIVAADPPGTPADSQLSLSPVVLTDIVQVAPSRVATVSAQTSPIVTLVTVTLTGQRSIASQFTTVEAHVERQLVRRGGDLDWEELSEPTELTPIDITGPVQEGTERRSGILLLLPPRTQTYRYRLVVEEFERYRTDGSSNNSYGVRVGGRVVLRRYPRDGRRLVHMDVIPITDLL
jgi:hypothetical protein